MTPNDRTLWQRFEQLPRAGRWAICAAVVITVFLVWNDFVGPQTASFNEEARTLLARHETIRGQQRLRQVKLLEEPIRALGTVEEPGNRAESGQALIRAVIEVLKKHSVSDDSWGLGNPTNLPRGTLTELTGDGRRVKRITADVRFDTGPEEATAIIAELEARPEVEAISNLRLSRLHGGRRKVRVALTLDAWIVSAEKSQQRQRGI